MLSRLRRLVFKIQRQGADARFVESMRRVSRLARLMTVKGAAKSRWRRNERTRTRTIPAAGAIAGRHRNHGGMSRLANRLRHEAEGEEVRVCRSGVIMRPVWLALSFFKVSIATPAKHQAAFDETNQDNPLLKADKLEVSYVDDAPDKKAVRLIPILLPKATQPA